MTLPRAIFFDLDNTLADSFTIPTPEMFQLLIELLDKTSIAIVSAANFERLNASIVDHVPQERLSHLYLFPLNGSGGFRREGSTWKEEYYLALTDSERDLIRSATLAALVTTGVADLSTAEGELFIDRGGMIAFTALGFDASPEEKVAWDPNRAKRRLILDHLQQQHPELFEHIDVAFGGRTGLDFTRKGVNKAYAVNWLATHLAASPSEMLFIGDALYEDGNDAVVIPTGIKTKQVANPKETLEVIRMLLS